MEQMMFETFTFHDEESFVMLECLPIHLEGVHP
jgi:hypothetical protein